MIKNFLKIKFIVVIPFLLAILSVVPGSLNQIILNGEIFFFQWLTRAEKLSRQIVVIAIGDDDVRRLDGWPITRDYYSYAVYALQECGAGAIGLDVFFSGPDKRYPRYDSTMADFLVSAGNVVLPMFFSDLNDQQFERSGVKGIQPNFSIPVINGAAIASGFSNLGRDPVIYKVPLVVNCGEASCYSFAVQLYRVYCRQRYPSENHGPDADSDKTDREYLQDLNRDGYIYINYPDFQDYQPDYGFVNFLQLFRNNPEALDLKGKIAVIINTVTGVCQLKSTPGNDRLPASLIHVAVVDNLIKRNWLHVLPSYWGWLIILIIGLVPLAGSIKRAPVQNKLYVLIIPLAYVAICLFSFLFLQLVLPLIYPLISFTLGLSVYIIVTGTAGQYEKRGRQAQLDELLGVKEEQLESARYQVKILNDKFKQESVKSRQTSEQVTAQKQLIADLEKELSDLQTYRTPQKKPMIIDREGVVYAADSRMKSVIETALKVSNDDIPVLILGETGTGKELVARIIHDHSIRKKAPFIAINCGALPENLLESELFGHEKGSFTGATSLRKGRFELAHGGTVFLDEVTETSPAFQTRLLRILQESTFERVGGQNIIATDIRIIAATNKDIQKMIASEKFRADLFYRLNGFQIILPPLRERVDDLPLLVSFFLKKHDYTDISGFSTQAMHRMQQYKWPGNVRELENCVRRAAVMAQSEGRSMIQEDDLPPDLKMIDGSEPLQFVHKPLEDQILELLRSFEFSRAAIAQTANLLGNRDRGTITEYFKGICFKYIVMADMNISEAARQIAGSTDELRNRNVRQKITDYLMNLKNYQDLPPQAKIPAGEQAPPFRGLPKKYHQYLDQILANSSLLSEKR